MEAPVEQRKHPRYRVYFKSVFSTDGVRLKDEFVLDLSRGGYRLKSPIHVLPDSIMQMHIRPGQDSAIYVPSAVVRWVGASAFGVQFNELPERESATLTHLLWTVRA